MGVGRLSFIFVVHATCYAKHCIQTIRRCFSTFCQCVCQYINFLEQMADSGSRLWNNMRMASLLPGLFFTIAIVDVLCEHFCWTFFYKSTENDHFLPLSWRHTQYKAYSSSLGSARSLSLRRACGGEDNAKLICHANALGSAFQSIC